MKSVYCLLSFSESSYSSPINLSDEVRVILLSCPKSLDLLTSLHHTDGPHRLLGLTKDNIHINQALCTAEESSF